MSNRSPFAPGSSPDIAARLRDALAINDASRAALRQSVDTLFNTADAQLSEIETRLARLLADIEGRSDPTLR